MEEEYVKNVNFHWTVYLRSIFLILMGFYLLFNNGINQNSLLIFLFFLLPLTYQILSNYCKKYLILPDRVYIEKGIFNKDISEIPFTRINNARISQGFIPRLFGAGDLIILTGNDQSVVIYGIENVKEFKEIIFKKIN